jgi:hypothetical protein
MRWPVNALAGNALAGNALASIGILYNSLTHDSFNAVAKVGSGLGELNRSPSRLSFSRSSQAVVQRAVIGIAKVLAIYCSADQRSQRRGRGHRF